MMGLVLDGKVRAHFNHGSHRMPYEHQLEKKKGEMVEVLRKITKQIARVSNYDVPAWVKEYYTARYLLPYLTTSPPYYTHLSPFSTFPFLSLLAPSLPSSPLLITQASSTSLTLTPASKSHN